MKCEWDVLGNLIKGLMNMLLLLVFLLLALWSVSVILFFMRSEEKTNLWFSGIFFVMGLGKVTAIMEGYLISHFWNNAQIAWISSRFIGTLSLRMLPYLILMASVSYFEYLNHCWKKKLKYWLMIPIIITMALDFVFRQEIIKLGLPQSSIYWATCIWIVPYYLLSSVFFYHAYYKETEPQKKQRKLIVFIVLSLPALMIMVNNLTTAFSKDWWKYTIVQNFIVLGAFIYFIGKYGLDGLQLRFKKVYESGQISGVALIGHAVRNELSAIHSNIVAARKGLYNIEDTLQNIDEATKHLSCIIDRIGRHIQDFVLKCENHQLSMIINLSLVSLECIFKEKNIQVSRSYFADPVVYCDQIHLSETIINILLNAIEAIEKDKGKIDIELTSTETEVNLKISDNGVGIPAAKLANVTDLFYSTKENAQFRGSGLYYCNSVIVKHNGELKINSEPNLGTVVEMTLPLGLNNKGHIFVEKNDFSLS